MAEEMFPQHPRSGPWETLKGSMLSPHEAAPIMSKSEGTSRHQTNNMPSMKWDSGVIVNTGLTRGGGTMAK